MDDIETSLERNLNDTLKALDDIECCMSEKEDTTHQSELRRLKAELQKSVCDTKEALLQLKKDRLLEQWSTENGCSASSETDSSTESDAGRSEPSRELVDDGHASREAYFESALVEMQEAVREAVKNGQQTETEHFAEWEAHGRGVASKLMAQMGYVPGKGLGRDKQGMTEHLVSNRHRSAKRAGLGTLDVAEVAAKKRTKRGGRLKTLRKRARQKTQVLEAERRQEELETDSKGVFMILNRVIGDHSEAAKAKRAKWNEALESTATAEKSGERSKLGNSKATREMLANQLTTVSDCEKKIARLKESVHRNSRNPSLLAALRLKLAEAQSELELAREIHSSLSRDVMRNAKNRQLEKF